MMINFGDNADGRILCRTQRLHFLVVYDIWRYLLLTRSPTVRLSPTKVVVSCVLPTQRLVSSDGPAAAMKTDVSQLQDQNCKTAFWDKHTLTLNSLSGCKNFVFWCWNRGILTWLTVKWPLLKFLTCILTYCFVCLDRLYPLVYQIMQPQTICDFAQRQTTCTQVHIEGKTPKRYWSHG